ncbi:LINE-1 reverse transcriptase isogeny [Gossypium australe]|uniref:LINE-1 reverse transcriptase isogeny n=1 Tax=Gossypium australe TaxID=47621 RepID=A0A5B6VHV6_9ROSI|nr:LINE-1 reverse transcriptase isogeny [Gossypium australe]
MRLAKEEERLSGTKICKSTLEISHLMFTDDCILFGDASERGVVLKSILKEYKDFSDQVKELVSQSLGVQYSTELKKYLGLPNMVGRENFKI